MHHKPLNNRISPEVLTHLWLLVNASSQAEQADYESCVEAGLPAERQIYHSLVAIEDWLQSLVDTTTAHSAKKEA